MTELQKKHPKALYMLFAVEMWERFSYYGMRGILILYLTKSIIEGGLGIAAENASYIYGIFAGILYATPMLGGYLADNYLGKRNAVMIGGFLMMLGQFSLFAMNNITGLWIGIAFLALGNGFFKPNISSIVGELYEPNDNRKDAAFSIFYMGVNLGALIAPLTIGYIAEDYFTTKTAAGEIITFGYKYGFLAAGLGMLLSQIIFISLAQKFLGNKGLLVAKPKNLTAQEKQDRALTKTDKDRITAIFIFSVFTIAFWLGFEQAGASMTLYTDRYIDRAIGDWTIPTAWFQSINAFFVVSLAPVIGWFWTTRKGAQISTPTKMGMGLILLGVGFIFMLGAIAQRGGDNTNPNIKAHYLWMIFTYLAHTLGELCLSPVGLSVVSKLSPARMVSFFMGVWFLASAVAHLLGGVVSGYVETLGAQSVFMLLSIFAIFAGIVMLLITKKVQKLMHGIS
jgi:POT family proton-dependent oligopeptide transporter